MIIINRTKIEWTNFSWNPITGCKYSCWFCYAQKLFTRFNKSFEPTFYPERLNELGKLKKASKIFCCSVSDIFAEWTKPEWRNQVIKAIEKYPQHTYQLLTKQPHLIDKDYKFGDNVWIGATVNNQSEISKIEEIKKVKCGIKFVSFEPLLSNIDCNLKGIDWVIVGKLTGSKRVPLQKEWVENIIKQTKALNIPLFIKDNVKWEKKIQTFPEGLVKLGDIYD